MLTPELISNCYTAEQIDAKIVTYQGILDTAMEAKVLEFDTGQGRQDVEYQKITDIQASLSLWMEAKQIKAGSTTSGARFVTLEWN